MPRDISDTQNYDGMEEAFKKSPYIKKVILENFLSFEKDEVDLGNSSFIIIVGPNWSGKTSIFQAIKFCLGSNERDERYQKWSDFIRHGQNHAMVELHIQEGKNEFKIRRTVVRGHSPYYHLMTSSDKQFNKVLATEVQEIVKRLNYNPDNEFALVSQGKIDAIKSLRPNELCKFLEQGIGLSSLRQEILQQKNNVLELNKNLQSLITKKNALSINLDMLKPKLARLKDKMKLVEERKTFEDELLWANRQALLEEIVTLGEIIKELEKKVQILENGKVSEEKKVVSILDKIKDLESSLTEMSEKLGALNNKKENLITEIETWQQGKIEKKKGIDLLEEKVKSQEKVLENYHENYDKLHKEIEMIKNEKEKINKDFEQILKEQQDLFNKIEVNKEILEQHDNLITEKAQKIKIILENEKNIKTLNSEINQIFQSIKDIGHKFEQNKWFLKDPTQNLLKKLDDDLRDTNFQLYDTDNDLQKKEIEKNKKLRDLSFLTESLRKRQVLLPTPISILKEEIIKRNLEAIGPIIEYLKYNDKMSYAIESILGEKVLYSFVASNWDTVELLRRLKNKYNAYCNIYLPKNISIKLFPEISAHGVMGYLAELIECENLDIKKVIYSVAKNTVVVKDFLSGKSLYKSTNFGGKCVTLNGEQISSLKYVYETPHIKKLKGFLSTGSQMEQVKILELEIKGLNDNISNLKVEASKLDHLQKEIYGKKKAFDDLLYNFNQRERLTKKKNDQYDKRNQIEVLNSTLKEELKDLESKITELEAKKDPKLWEWNQRIKELPAEMSNLKIEEKKWDKNLDENVIISKELEEKINNNTTQLHLLKSQYNTEIEAFRKADNKAFQTYRTLEETEEKLNELQNVMAELKIKKGDLEQEKSSIERKKVEIELELERKNIELNTEKKEFFHKNDDLNRINDEIGPLISERKIEIRTMEEIKKDLYRLDQELLKYYDVDESLLVERDHIMSSLKEISQNQANLEQDIKGAIKTENKLEKTYTNRFKKVLNNIELNINQKFSKANINVQCSLYLTGEFEDLEVDVKAATGNNQFISCSALSGGQLSMISICLILSLQEIKPSPLCMLDEAGMFLDERNSEAAYQLIRSTLEHNPIQMILFLPKSSKALFSLAEKLIGVARTGKNEASTILIPKLIPTKNKNNKTD